MSLPNLFIFSYANFKISFKAILLINLLDLKIFSFQFFHDYQFFEGLFLILINYQI